MNNKCNHDNFSPSFWLNSSLLAFVSLGLNTNHSLAQIVPDTTLGNGFNSVVTPDQLVNPTVFSITGGHGQDSTLFHSFSDFNVPANTTAFFQNGTNIEQIFSRVIGGNASDISGTIQTNGAADLFLINPAGIMFNEGASLKMEGSFFATTATNIDFGNGQQFSAVNPPTRSPSLR
ncbi:MAG: filamentous hemagglutinin N-terminal domain-containing protein [Synechococcaceae cyanobacterium RL_1_2]|nr:filamentous hemagglutinin N-terminal domain-containing protein [Synechococcaceae cyanobacterium RL_1_2]